MGSNYVKMAMFNSVAFILVVTWTVVSASSCGLEVIHKDTIDSSTTLCCNGVTHAKHVNGKERDCCTSSTGVGQIYHKEDGRCCNGTIRVINPNMKQDEPICCGNELIMDQSTEICCGDNPYPRSTYKCDKRSHLIDILLRHNQIACYKRIRPEDYVIYTYLGYNYKCCGKEYFNPFLQTHECWYEELVPVNKTERCGGRGYNKDRDVCCHETGTTIPIPDDIKFNGVAPGACINGSFIDTYKVDVLMKDGQATTVPQGKIPCGSSYYESTMKDPMVHCCDGVLNYNKEGSNVECCGNVTIDLSEKTCCNNTIYPLKKQCCGDVPYDENSSVSCCEDELINRTTHLCCGKEKYGGRKRPKSTNLDDKCCELTPYDSGKKSCCGQNVLDHWNQSTQTCVGNQVRNLTIPTKTLNVIKQAIIKTRRIHEECLGCPTTLKPDTVCTKRYEYRFSVLYLRKGSMDVVLLSPKSLEGTRLTLRSRDLCPCVKEGKSYSIFTNRDYRRKILDQVFSLSFSKRDIITHLRMEGKRMRPAIQCSLYRFHKETKS